MNPFRKIANSLMNWWKGETAPEVSDWIKPCCRFI